LAIAAKNAAAGSADFDARLTERRGAGPPFVAAPQLRGVALLLLVHDVERALPGGLPVVVG
jgi:hypothetical protein